MGEPSPGTSPSAKPPEDRLDSWKEIAAYLNRDVTTVQRWEKREGMPVHRHLHDRLGSVYTSRAELEEWSRTRNPATNAENESPSASILPEARPTSLRRSPAWPLVLIPALAVAALGIGLFIWLHQMEYFWRSPVADGQPLTVTDFEGVEEAAALSRDGKFVAFLSDHEGKMDVWVTQLGSGEFHNLTHGTAPELVNPSVRTLGFSPDGSLITFWARKQDGSPSGDISIWAVPTLGGQSRPYLPGVAEFDWSRDGSRLAYHTPGPGDPLFLSDRTVPQLGAKPIFTAPPGLHSHFPLWSPDSAFIYFVQGTLPDKLDIWRIRPTGGAPQRITSHSTRVTHPVFLDGRTLLYLATDLDGSGPWLHSIDVERRISHRLTSGLDRYTSLAASADGHRLVLTLASPKSTLWRLPLPDVDLPSPGHSTPSPPASSTVQPSNASRISLTTGTGFSPRLGPNYLLYVSPQGPSDSIWKSANGNTTELWTSPGARLLGAPAISPDGRSIAFSVRQREKSFLYAIQSDGANPKVIADSLDLQGSPAWAPDGQSITSAANDHGAPHLFRIPLDGRPPTPLVSDYSVDPAWSPDGQFVVYSGPDIGTTFTLKAVTPQSAAHPLPDLTLTRGARHVAFLPNAHSLVLLRGEIQHKNLWLTNLETGVERQLTNLPADFDVRDFDISPDAHELILERVQQRSDVTLLDLPRQ
jgi:Tol biopolymer transport system component